MYSHVDQRLWLLDQTGTGLSVLRIAQDGSSETVASWPSSAQYDTFWMALDPNGWPLLVGSSALHGQHRIVRFALGGAAVSATATTPSAPALGGAPYVDTRGVAFLDATTGGGVTIRRPFLGLDFSSINILTSPFP